MKNKLKAFTLIELLVVIAIIGILAAVVYAPFQKARAKGRDAKKVAEMKSIQTALSLYADSNGSYPLSLSPDDFYLEDFEMPKNITEEGGLDLNKYNYTAYIRNNDNKVVKYHLYTHLETASPALDGAAKCLSVGRREEAKEGQKFCLNANIDDYTQSINGRDDVERESLADYNFEDHSQDSDTNCSNDTSICIFDLTGGIN